MPRIIAILFEEKITESYVAIQLDGDNPKVLFTKGPSFSKTMGPFPKEYAEATFRKWHYCMIENPPKVNLKDKVSIRYAIEHLQRCDNNIARYSPQRKGPS